jgi:predicted TIM-barrel enzyme
MGLTTSGSIGAQTALSLDDCVQRVMDIQKAAREIRSDVFVLCHGGPIAMPTDAAYMLKNVPGLDGFYGASSMERLPTEIAIKAQVEAFTTLQTYK